MVDAYEGNAFLRLKANPKYWGGKPAFETVVFKFVPDADQPRRRDRERLVRRHARSALRGIRPPEGARPASTGVATPISDIGMIFITNNDADARQERPARR